MGAERFEQSGAASAYGVDVRTGGAWQEYGARTDSTNGAVLRPLIKHREVDLREVTLQTDEGG